MDSPNAVSASKARLLVGLVVLLCFAQSLFGDFVWDDRSLILENPSMRDPSSLWELVSTPFWAQRLMEGGGISPLYSWLHRPLIKLVYHFGLRLGGGSPFPFHVLDVGLHLGCAFLVFDHVRSRLPAALTTRDVAACLAAIVFAIHPSRVESVAWISGVTDVAMTFFLLLALRFSEPGATSIRWVAAFACFALAGWSKETAVLAPVLVLADGIALGRARPHIVRASAVASGASALVAATWFAAVRRSAASTSEASASSLPGRVLATLGTFVERVLWPAPATVYPGRILVDGHGAMHFSPVAIALGALAVLGAAALCVAAIRRRSARHWLSPLAFTLVPLLPVSNVILRQGAALAADRFLYLPLFGVLLFAAEPVARLLELAPSRRAVGVVGIAAVVLGCSLETLRSTERFLDDRSLFQHEVAVNPTHVEANDNLIRAYRHDEDFQGASRVAIRALGRAHSDHDREAEIHFALAYLSVEVARRPELDRVGLLADRAAYDGLSGGTTLAIEDGRIRLRNELPIGAARRIRTNAELFVIPRALAHAKTNDPAGAVRILDAFVRSTPELPNPYDVLALSRARTGDFEGALLTIRLAIQRFPHVERFPTALDLIQRSQILASRSIPDPALAIVRDANVQLMLGSPGAARELLEPLVVARPDILVSRLVLAQAEAMDGQRDRASRVLDAAAIAFPNSALVTQQRAELDAQARPR